MAPLGFTESLRSLGSAVSQWILVSMRSHSAAMLSLVPQCHSVLLVPRGTTVPNMFPSFHKSLRSSTGPLDPWGPAVSQWPHHYTRSFSVTMLCMAPQSPAVSQWPLWFHKDPQCHNGPLALWCHVTHSVTLVLSVPHGPAVSQWPLASPGPFSVTIITESPRLEKNFKSIKSNL